MACRLNLESVVREERRAPALRHTAWHWFHAWLWASAVQERVRTVQKNGGFCAAAKIRAASAHRHRFYLQPSAQCSVSKGQHARQLRPLGHRDVGGPRLLAWSVGSDQRLAQHEVLRRARLAPAPLRGQVLRRATMRVRGGRGSAKLRRPLKPPPRRSSRQPSPRVLGAARPARSATQCRGTPREAASPRGASFLQEAVSFF